MPRCLAARAGKPRSTLSARPPPLRSSFPLGFAKAPTSSELSSASPAAVNFCLSKALFSEEVLRGRKAPGNHLTASETRLARNTFERIQMLKMEGIT